MSVVVRELEGRTAIVAGASRGVGRATAERLAAAGARVVLTARGAEAGEAAAAGIRAAGGQAIFVQADQSRDEDWSKTIDAAERAFGGLDVLVVNTVAPGPVPTVELSLAGFRAQNQISLKGPFLGVKHATAALRRGGQGGAIALIASVAGKIGVTDRIHYAATQGGVRLLAKAAALELGPEKIRVNAILSGLSGADEAAQVPLKRAVEPEDIADAALFLASERSIFMTGAEIVVDGGRTVQ